MEMYVDHLEKIDAEGGPAWESENETIRALAGIQLLEQFPMHEVPFSVVREFVVIPDLLEKGMPADPRPEWLDVLVDDATEQRRAAARAEEAARAQLPSRKRGGHPLPKAFNFMVVSAAYFAARHDQPNATENSLCERVLQRLGPGVNRNSVRREMTRFRRLVGSSSAKWRELQLMSVLDTIDLLAVFDEAHPPARGGVLKQTPSLRCLRTKPSNMVSAPPGGAPA